MPTKKEEDKWIAQEEASRIKALQEEKKRKDAEEEKEKLKELHWMRCPKCGMELEEIEQDKVTVDVCTSCGGMWLDQGELDQLREADTESEGRFVGALRVLMR